MPARAAKRPPKPKGKVSIKLQRPAGHRTELTTHGEPTAEMIRDAEALIYFLSFGKRQPLEPKLAKIGAQVGYCGHDASFVADVFEVGGAVVIVANGGPIDSQLRRPAGKITHRFRDFPNPGFWGRHRGVFVVPREQVELVDAADEEG